LLKDFFIWRGISGTLPSRTGPAPETSANHSPSAIGVDGLSLAGTGATSSATHVPVIEGKGFLLSCKVEFKIKGHFNVGGMEIRP